MSFTINAEEIGPCVGVYPCPEGVLDWLVHTLWPVDQKSFEHFQRLKPVLDKADRNERGDLGDFVFEAALRAFNDRHHTRVTKTELLCLSTDYVMADAGDWVVWTDKPDALLRADSDNIETAAYGAPEDVRWAMLYLPREQTLTVYRSPYVDGREFWAQEGCESTLTNLPAAKGRVRGKFETWVLPPPIEGLITQERGRG